jgi:type I restriction enzyme M protein
VRAADRGPHNPENRNQRKALWDEKKNPAERFRAFGYDELVARDECSLDLFRLKDESLEDSARLPDPHILAEEIAEDRRSAPQQIESVLGDLQARARLVAKE